MRCVSRSVLLETSRFLPPASEGWGRYCFRRCLSVHRGAVTPSTSHNTSTGPMSSLGGLPHLHLHTIILPLIPCPFHGVPHLHPIILPLVPCPFWGYPSPRWGDWGTPQPGQDGVPPPPPPPGQNSRTRTCYAAGGMPLAFTQEDCLVSFFTDTSSVASHKLMYVFI